MPQVGFELLRRFEATDSGLLLRRYINHSKFVRLVESGALHFAPASTFADALEGHYTHLDNELSDAQLAGWGLDSHARAIASTARAGIAKSNQKAVVICCWASGIEEDPRMWSEYGQEQEAVALETTVGDLRRALGTDFLIVPVSYVDFSRDTIPKEHSLQPFFFKRRTFSWEREVRVVGEMEIGKRIGSSRLVPVDIGAVFRRVVISPAAPSSYLATVASLLESASLPLPVHESVLGADAAQPGDTSDGFPEDSRPPGDGR